MKVAIMTCGGDCAGLNAVVRAVVVRAVRGYCWSVHGVRSGFWGLINQNPDDIVPLDVFRWEKQDCLLERGGTFLQTTLKHLPATPSELQEVAKKGANFFREQGFDALIVVGGDVSFSKAKAFSDAGIPIVGVAKTIDNDVTGTKSVGFASAIQVGVDAIDRVRTTAASHNRVFVVEIMGRDAGFLPLSVAIAGGADVALIPEIPYDALQVISAVKKRMERDRYAIVVTSEAAQEINGEKTQSACDHPRYRGAAHKLEDTLSQALHVGVRGVILGHVQRGGSPIAHDRILGCRQGVAAVDALASGEKGVVVGWDGAQSTRMPLSDVHVTQLSFESHLVKLAQKMDIFLGKEL